MAPYMGDRFKYPWTLTRPVPQQMMPERKKRKKDEKLAFDAGKVFDEVKPAEDVEVELDKESSTYRAMHGQGGDRRA